MQTRTFVENYLRIGHAARTAPSGRGGKWVVATFVFLTGAVTGSDNVFATCAGFVGSADVPFCQDDDHPEIFVTAGSTTNSIYGSSNCDFGFQAPYKDAWFSFIAPSTGIYTIDTCGSTGNSALAVYTSCTSTGSALFGSNPDLFNCSSGDTTVDLFLNGGTKYWIEVGLNNPNPIFAGGGDTGDSLVLHISNVMPCTPAPPSSATHTQSSSCAAIGTVTLTANGGGGTGATLRWYLGGTCSGGSIGSGDNLVISNPATTTTYSARWEHPQCGNSACVNTTVTVDALPADPTNAAATPASICSGQSSDLTASVAGAQIDWYTGSCGGTFAGTGNTLNVSPSTTTTYFARARDAISGCESTNCDSVILSVDATPIDPINALATPSTICSGDTSSLTASVAGAVIDWYTGSCGGVFVATGNSIIVSPSSTTAYFAQARDAVSGCVSGNCDMVTVTVDAAPTITLHPASQTECVNGSAMFTVTAGGIPAPTFQWRHNGIPVSGETGSTLVINPIGAGDAGIYDVVVTNVCGVVTSNIATLTVNLGPSISAQPAGQDACEGGMVTFSVTAAGTPPITFQWLKDGGPIGGETNDSLTIDPVTLGDAANYSVVVNDLCGLAFSNIATLTVFSTGGGDVNGDGLTNGRDIQMFADILINSPAGPPSQGFCAADMSGNGLAGIEDIALFVQALLL